ncbi:MAG TPA: 50S ribosomal protein L21 [Methyloceanibacter sp.]|jgi:large subunit ribosomal protein L21|nr:50S ribosomal protein L21 [Methyloceanibacter sp.]
MFAVIRTGGKQYRVAPNDVIEIEKIAGKPGDIVELAEVLLLGGGDSSPKAGAPLIAGAAVAAEVVEQGRGEKIRIFKKKRRKGYRRTKGHRQLLTTVRITEILTDGKKPSKAAASPAPKKAEKPVEAKAPKKEAAKPEKKAAAKPAAKKAAPKSEKPAAKAKKSEAKKPARAAKPKPKA